MVVRNHPFILFWPGLKAVFFLLIGIAALMLLKGDFPALIFLVCIVVGIGIFARSYFDFSQSVFLITTERLLYVDQEGFWKKRIIETDRDKVQDVSSRVSGVSKIILKYGDLIIRTAGASVGSEIVVKDIPNPYEVQQSITRKN